MRRQFLTGLVVAGVFATQTVAGAAAAEPAPDLTSAVVARLDGQTAAVTAAAGTTPRVNVTKQDDGWAFGTAVLATAPNSEAMPVGWLFVAHRDGARWQVALEGEAAFADLTAKAPVVSEVERPLLAAQDGAQPRVRAANGDFRTGMALPYLRGQSWGMYGGPHGWDGDARPWSSLDFAGGDQVVRSVRSGTAYTMCQGWIRVIHDRGYATDYYHLWSTVNVNGAAVGFGTYLGNTGTDVTCGGAATGRHVHFGLRQNSAYVNVANHNLGKWVLQDGGSAYQGSARQHPRQRGRLAVQPRRPRPHAGRHRLQRRRLDEQAHRARQRPRRRGHGGGRRDRERGLLVHRHQPHRSVGNLQPVEQAHRRHVGQ